MKAKILDPDDKVRAAVCRAYGDLDFETAAYHASEAILRKLGERLRDKKVNPLSTYQT
jgi:sister chromatid cohesion protein PDS5